MIAPYRTVYVCVNYELCMPARVNSRERYHTESLASSARPNALSVARSHCPHGCLRRSHSSPRFCPFDAASRLDILCTLALICAAHYVFCDRFGLHSCLHCITRCFTRANSFHRGGHMLGALSRSHMEQTTECTDSWGVSRALRNSTLCVRVSDSEMVSLATATFCQCITVIGAFGFTLTSTLHTNWQII